MKLKQLVSDLCHDKSIDWEKFFKIVQTNSITVKEIAVDYKNDQTNDNLLIYAARLGNLNLIKLLNEAHIDCFNINYTNRDGKNALHEACQNGHYECVVYLVEQAHVDVNALRKGDWTPLMLACTRNNLSIIEYLLDKNASLRQVNKDGWNAFQIAVREGNEKIIRLLLDRDPNLAFEVKTKNKRTPLHTAALHGHLNVLKMILNDNENRVGSMLNARDSCGNNVLMEAALADNLTVVQYLIQTYPNIVNIYDQDALGNSILHLVAQSGSVHCCEFLFDLYFKRDSRLNDKNRNLNDTLALIGEFSQTLNSFKMTPLHSACKNNKPDIVQVIFNKLIGSDIESSQLAKNQIRALLHQPDSHDRSSMDIVKVANLTQILNIFNKFTN